MAYFLTCDKCGEESPRAATLRELQNDDWPGPNGLKIKIGANLHGHRERTVHLCASCVTATGLNFPPPKVQEDSDAMMDKLSQFIFDNLEDALRDLAYDACESYHN